MKKFLLSALTLFFICPAHSEEEIGLFGRAASFAAGMASKTAEQSLESVSEDHANKDPEHADMIRLKAKAGVSVIHKAGEKAFEAAGVSLPEETPPSDPSNIQVGIYKNMVNNTDNNTVVHPIPSKRWFTTNGYNVDNALAIRIPKSLNANLSANEDISKPANVVVINDLKNLRDVFLNAGADYTKLRQKIVEIVSVSNATYSKRH